MSPTDELLTIAERHDTNDPLAANRDEFHVVDPELAYLDGNSLGMPPKRTFERVERLARGWGGRADPQLGALARHAPPGRQPAGAADRRPAR